MLESGSWGHSVLQTPALVSEYVTHKFKVFANIVYPVKIITSEVINR